MASLNVPPPCVSQALPRRTLCNMFLAQSLALLMYIPLARPAPPQALSKRIHYGMFVAEAKFREKPEQYSELIRRRDEEGIMELLTDRAVEQKVR